MENFQKLLELKKDLIGIDNLVVPGRVSQKLDSVANVQNIHSVARFRWCQRLVAFSFAGVHQVRLFEQTVWERPTAANVFPGNTHSVGFNHIASSDYLFICQALIPSNHTLLLMAHVAVIYIHPHHCYHYYCHDKLFVLAKRYVLIIQRSTSNKRQTEDFCFTFHCPFPFPSLRQSVQRRHFVYESRDDGDQSV